jgi:hypothetical protein
VGRRELPSYDACVLALRPSTILALALAAAVDVSTAPAHAEDTGSRWIAALPFGVGQLQNGDVGLGVALAVGEVLLAGTSIATSAVVNRLASTDPAPGVSSPVVDLVAVNDRIDALVTLNRIAFIGWAALTAAGVVEAQVSYGPRHSPPRPASPPITATVAPVLGGGVVGLRGVF